MDDEPDNPRPLREDYERALQSMHTFIDIEVDDLMTLADRARHFATQRPAKSLTVARIMNSPVHTIGARTTMAEAAHRLVAQRISGLPVVDDTGRLCGIITEADFLRGLGVPAHHPTHNLWQTLESLFSHLAQGIAAERPEDPVADHMVRDVVHVAPDARIDEVIALMKQHRVKRILVCDGDGRVVGIVTRSDLVRIFFDRYTGSRDAT
ncbi:MAG: CBS domain-containing protein [Chromatiaceae bacterium]|nr:CBS domain-containing protein [Chromatiaceae bacterium]MCP5422717.1 CBS domain-containing protein [Chromatiaceae bacterium]